MPTFYVFLASESRPSPSLLTWEAIHRKMPWSLVLLLGGGFALAKASMVSGLSAMMGRHLETLGIVTRLHISRGVDGVEISTPTLKVGVDNLRLF